LPVDHLVHFCLTASRLKEAEVSDLVRSQITRC
jgi:hypothetical protein